VLVVEDEPELRGLILRILGEAGFAVLGASGGVEALVMAANHPGTLHALLTDIVMPGDDGFTVARRVSELRPGIPVAYMSGYTDDVHAADGDTLLLRKPFMPADLLAHVRRAVDSGAAMRQS
jgi:two-component system, cell cycle sensor histidine kinase and response regulator CckA